jgi:hypothetical protein
LADSFYAAASERASAVTVSPALINSSVTADPMNPVAPVTKLSSDLSFFARPILGCDPNSNRISHGNHPNAIMRFLSLCGSLMRGALYSFDGKLTRHSWHLLAEQYKTRCERLLPTP